MKYCGIIYVLENKINRKKYVGQTTGIFKRRLSNHISSKSLIGMSINKYGIDNFTIYLYEKIPIEYLDYVEIELISRLKTVSPNGYNLHLGGQYNRVFSEETKRKISVSKKGCTISSETRKKISEANSGQKRTQEQKNNISMSLIGIKRTKLHTEHWIESRVKNGKSKGANNPSAKKIRCIETGEIFDTMSLACSKKNISLSAISNCCNLRSKTCNGLHWEYVQEE